MKQKLENFSVSYIETIAGKRQRNVEWAKSAVKESASITAEKALQLKVIDLIAPDISDLLQKLNGRVVEGKTLKTAGANAASGTVNVVTDPSALVAVRVAEVSPCNSQGI